MKAARLSNSSKSVENNCAVVAIAALRGKGYKKIERELTKAGVFDPTSKKFKGMAGKDILSYLAGHGDLKRVEGLDKKRMSTALKSLQKDTFFYTGVRYLVLTAKHGAAIVESRLFDTAPMPNSKVTAVFEFTPEVAAKANIVYDTVLAKNKKGIYPTCAELAEELNLKDKVVRNLVDSSRRAGRPIVNESKHLRVVHAQAQ